MNVIVLYVGVLKDCLLDMKSKLWTLNSPVRKAEDTHRSLFPTSWLFGKCLSLAQILARQAPSIFYEPSAIAAMLCKPQTRARQWLQIPTLLFGVIAWQHVLLVQECSDEWPNTHRAKD